MTVSKRPKTPSEMLRRAATWVAENAGELVASDGVYVTKDGLDLDVTIHLRSCNFTTVTVDGRTDYIVLERRENKEDEQ